MKAIIIAESMNRLTKGNKPIALMRLCGLTLLQRSLYTLSKAGVNAFSIICDHDYDSIDYYIKKTKLNAYFNLTLLRNIEDVQLDSERFLILDVNVIFEPDIISKIVENAEESLIACVDSSPKYMEVNADSPKEPQNVGIFSCDKQGLALLKGFGPPNRLGVLPKQATNGCDVIIHDVSGEFWYRIDTPHELKKAEAILWERNLFHIGGPSDFVCQFVRKFPAKLAAKCLIRIPITANQVTLLTFLSFISSAVLLSFGQRNYDIIAGVLVLFALILDHADGIVARMKLSASSFGGWLDSVSDIFGYYSIIFGATVGLYIHTHQSLIWLVGMFLLFLESMFSYVGIESKEKLKMDSIHIADAALGLGDGTPLRKIYNFYTKVILPKYFDWGVLLLLISIGAFISKMWLVFLIIIIIKFAPTPMSLFMRLKVRGVFQ